MLSFWDLLRPVRRRYALGLAALFLVNLSDVLAPIFMAVAVDLTEAELTGKPPRTPPVLAMLGLDSAIIGLTGALVMFVGLHLLANLSRWPMLIHVAVPSHEIGQRVRNDLVGKLLALSRSFYDRSKSGDLMSLATADVNAVRMMMGPGVLVLGDVVFIISLVVMVLFALSPSLTLITLIPLPMIYLITNKLSHAEYERFEAVQEHIAYLTERSRESYAGIRILQGYAREDFDRERFQGHSWSHYLKNLRLARVRALFDPSLDLMLGLSTVLVLLFGGLQVLRGELSLGSFVAYLFLINYLAGPMIGLGWSISLFQRGRASLDRNNELLDEPIAVQDIPQAKEASGPGLLEVRDLHFSYPPGRLVEGDQPQPEAPREVLQGVSFRLEPGARLGILGAVGSGKTTLASLLVRLYEPPGGTIFLDGADVRTLQLDSLRRQVVLAPQDTFLFSDTVARNILMASPDAAHDDPQRYARLACLHEEIEALDEGYETMLGERGVNLSGGQRQRLAIARAIATDPQLLILDDCLSAVDANTEEAILQQLRDIFAGRSGIIISHRVRAVERCDEILVLDEGRVVERGTHGQLVARGGQYARLYAEQSGAPLPRAQDEGEESRAS